MFYFGTLDRCSEKFYRKLQFVANVEELYGVIPPTNLELPEEVMEYEQSLHAPAEPSGVSSQRHINPAKCSMRSDVLLSSASRVRGTDATNVHVPKKQGKER